MKNGVIQLIDLEFEYKIWKKRLDLFSSEVELIVSRNTHLPEDKKHKSLNAVELLALEVHKEALEKLKGRIKTKEQELKFYNKDFPITEVHDFFLEHLELRSKNEKMLQLHLDRISDIVTAIGV
ncbi:hypothetical protein SAMN06265379_10823 [Saccharicrinis carchari]|uniref:Uncharacterized protein n=1 Tax=Saccharicrinis carchari TaxID=1168039 RepID=A0A521E9W5_SACCC|nr:hypothetical protein [Saccharicrinis carchari]SMO80241.1 hypothetical protein SAMN06265379_10823 [Saccharicrinis carchari]